jgi:hypothetical protein
VFVVSFALARLRNQIARDQERVRIPRAHCRSRQCRPSEVVCHQYGRAATLMSIFPLNCVGLQLAAGISGQSGRNLQGCCCRLQGKTGRSPNHNVAVAKAKGKLGVTGRGVEPSIAPATSLCRQPAHSDVFVLAQLQRCRCRCRRRSDGMERRGIRYANGTIVIAVPAFCRMCEADTARRCHHQIARISQIGSKC